MYGAKIDYKNYDTGKRQHLEANIVGEANIDGQNGESFCVTLVDVAVFCVLLSIVAMQQHG